MRKQHLAPLAALAALALAGTAQAHGVGHSGPVGLTQGLAHPLGGVDHLLAMVAIGLWAAQSGGRALWLVPGAFVAAMTLGMAAALAGIGLPLVELGIVASLLVLGALVAGARALPAAAGMALVGLFALFHGHAHGAEMPGTASALAYGAGMALATAALHGAGIAVVLGLRRPLLVRAGGAAIAAAGLVLLVG